MLFDKIPEVNSDTIIHAIQERTGGEPIDMDVNLRRTGSIAFVRIWEPPIHAKATTLRSALVDLYCKLREVNYPLWHTY